ncbi:hypothetical protein [Imhoffiella purpurea]|uniref:hypothetical protein n=1 Tax=Imhoffiella purpurea TaxID=1249627 RepID=UPI0012FDEFA3|nr:hypothetical protein [Imhoffiella purpurea]
MSSKPNQAPETEAPRPKNTTEQLFDVLETIHRDVIDFERDTTEILLRHLVSHHQTLLARLDRLEQLVQQQPPIKPE